MTEQAVPAWFENAIIDGLTMLYPLSLEGTPSSETVTATADVWINVLWPAKQWHQRLDEQRIRRGFAALARNVDRWPWPMKFLDTLPARPPQPGLPGPQLTPEQRKANRERLRTLINDVLSDRSVK